MQSQLTLEPLRHPPIHPSIHTPPSPILIVLGISFIPLFSGALLPYPTPIINSHPLISSSSTESRSRVSSYSAIETRSSRSWPLYELDKLRPYFFRAPVSCQSSPEFARVRRSSSGVRRELVGARGDGRYERLMPHVGSSWCVSRIPDPLRHAATAPLIIDGHVQVKSCPTFLPEIPCFGGSRLLLRELEARRRGASPRKFLLPWIREIPRP
jgi:hypothetical protein